MSFGENLKRIRTAKRWSQSKLANASGIDKKNISKYENGMRIPSVYTAYDIAKALGVTLEELVGVA